MLPALVVLLVYTLHQDLWFWREARPLILGVLPVGLAYHAAYTLGVPLLMAFLIRRLWPAHLEAVTPIGDRGPGDGPPSEPQTSAARPAVPGAPEPRR
jgi:hypothetical protein